MKVAFVDRDGTVIYEPPDGHVYLKDVRILPGVTESLRKLQDDGFTLVLVSNQSDTGTEQWRIDEFYLTQNKLDAELIEHGVQFDHVFLCPHNDDQNCNCRKPKTGMVDAFLLEHDIDTQKSCMVGDRDTDGMFADRLGIHFYKMEPNSTFPEYEELQQLLEE